MEKSITLKDGSTIVIRDITTDDADQSIAFFSGLPEGDRIYMRNDVSNPDVVRQRIENREQYGEIIIVAVSGNEIIADGSLELETHGWKKHLGEIRLVVSPGHQHKGLGMHMARELYFLASSEKVEKIIAKIMKPQVSARKILTRLGFSEAMHLPRYVKDLKGHHQDLIVMRCDLKEMWGNLDEYFTETDWERRK